MCGIVGYIGNKSAFELLKNALKRLEYRGYDSAGIALLDKKGKIFVHKDKGRIEDVLKEKKIDSTIGIAHTRWATHGKVNKENAHPQTDCFGKIAIVHNGVIENAEEIKAKLSSHHFSSSTDTEVVAHLLEEKLKTMLPMEALRETVKEIKGSFALAILIEGENRIYFAKKDSPLLIGIGKDEMFLSSDIAGFIEHTNDYIALEDYDFGYVEKGRYALFNAISGKKASRKALKALSKAEEVEKGEYEHFMLKEIEEQLTRLNEMFSSPIERAIEMINEKEKLHIVGAGTSYHASLLLKYLLEKNHKIESDAVISSEYRFLKEPDEKTLVIAFSQSGETADTLKTIRFAKQRGAKVIAITNIRGSSIDRLSDFSIYLNAGLEVGVAATKTFLAQMIASYRIASNISSKEIKELLSYGIKQREKIIEEAKNVAKYKHIFYLGRYLSYPMALEGSLKLKEITYIHAEAYPAGELKHGPLSLIDKNALAIVLLPKDITYEKTLSNIEEVKARGARVIAITDSLEGLNGVEKIMMAKAKREELYPFSELIQLQLLAYYTALELGRDTDKPRNLAKSVTVE